MQLREEKKSLTMLTFSIYDVKAFNYFQEKGKETKIIYEVRRTQMSHKLTFSSRKEPHMHAIAHTDNAVASSSTTSAPCA